MGRPGNIIAWKSFNSFLKYEIGLYWACLLAFGSKTNLEQLELRLRYGKEYETEVPE